LGAGRPLSLTARGPTAFVVGLIAVIIRVAALLVEEWLRATPCQNFSAIVSKPK
jgi:hypothetical protein